MLVMRGDWMRIYVAGAYSADSHIQVAANVKRAIEVGIVLMKKGHSVFVPHFNYLMKPLSSFGYDDFMANDLQFLKVCEAIFVDSISKGVLLEIEVAREYHLREFYNLEDVWEVTK